MEKAKFIEDCRIIRNAMLNNKLVLFIGAGLSIDSGIPKWNDVSDIIANKLYGKDIPSNIDNLKIAQYYYNSRGNKEYVELIRDIFKYNKDLNITEVHKQIVELNTHTIITTNYDNLLEKAFLNNNEFVQVIREDKELSYKTSEKEIIKIHGDLERGNFVLKEDDYLYYGEEFKLIETYTKSLIATNVVLFLGYSFNDPDIKQIFAWVKKILKNDVQRAYLLNVEDSYDDYMSDYFKNFGLNVIYVADLDDEFSKAGLSERTKLFLDRIIKDGETENDIEKIDKEYSLYKELNYISEKYINRIFSQFNIFCNMGELRYYGDDEDRNLLTNLYKGQGKSVNDGVKLIISKSCVTHVEAQGETYNINNRGFDEDLEKAIQEFDIKKLKDIGEENELFLSDEEPVRYLRQAYIYYMLFDYLKAYKYIRLSSRKFYQKKQYVMYFISEFNRKNLARIIRTAFYSPISDEEKEIIRKEAEEIDLDRIYKRIPTEGQQSKDFLNDIMNFNVYYSTFQQVYRTSQKVDKESKKKYIFNYGDTEYSKIRYQIKDLYNYDLHNYILVDRYIEDLETYRLFVRAILESACSPDLKDEYGCDDLHNIHVRELEEFDIYICIKFMQYEELRDILSYNCNDHIRLNKNAIEYLKKVIDNTAENLNIIYFYQYYYNSLILASYIKLEQQIVDALVRAIKAGVKSDIFEHNLLLVKRTIKNIYDQGFLNGDNILNKTKEIIDIVAENVIVKKGQDSRLNDTLVYLLYLYNQSKGKFYSDQLKKLSRQEYFELLGQIYLYCSRSIQKNINNTIKRWKWSNKTEELTIYERLVLNDLIKPDPEVEDFIINDLKKTQNVAGVKMNPDPYKGKIETLLNLLLNNKIIYKDKIKEEIRRSKYHEYIWLADINNFDYKEFNINWLNLCSDKLLKTISENEKARKGIINKIRCDVKIEDVGKDITQKVLKYFL